MFVRRDFCIKKNTPALKKVAPHASTAKQKVFSCTGMRVFSGSFNSRAQLALNPKRTLSAFHRCLDHFGAPDDLLIGLRGALSCFFLEAVSVPQDGLCTSKQNGESCHFSLKVKTEFFSCFYI